MEQRKINEMIDAVKGVNQKCYLDLDKASLEDIIDLFGFLKALESDVKQLMDPVKSKLADEVGPGNKAEGQLFRVSVSQSTKWYLNTKLVKEEMGEDWVTQRSSPSTSTTVRSSARSGLGLAAA